MDSELSPEGKQYPYRKALKGIQKGEGWRRANWKNASYVFLLRPTNMEFQTSKLITFDESVVFNPFIACLTPDNNIHPWAPSNQDQLAEDWERVR